MAPSSGFVQTEPEPGMAASQRTDLWVLFDRASGDLPVRWCKRLWQRAFAFYSRRIGLDSGTAVPIEGGGRVTGRAGPYTLGALNVQTDDNEAGARWAARVRVLSRLAVELGITWNRVELPFDRSRQPWSPRARPTA